MKRGQRVQTPDGPGIFIKRVSEDRLMVQLDDAPELNGERVTDVFDEKDVREE